MNVLAVVANAPGLPKLASSEELARIGDVAGVTLRTLTDATAQRVAHRLSQEDFDLLLWIGHGEEGYLLVQDGRIDPQWLAAQLSSRQVDRAVIATCWSGIRPEGGQQAALSFADALPAAGIDTITMNMEISDRAAIEYDVELLRQLASGSTLRTAHQVALNRAQQWGGVKAPQLTPRDGISPAQMLRGLDVKMDQMSDQIAEIRRRQERLDDRMLQLETQVRHMNTAPGYSRLWLAIGGGVMAFMLLLMLIITWRLL